MSGVSKIAVACLFGSAHAYSNSTFFEIVMPKKIDKPYKAEGDLAWNANFLGGGTHACETLYGTPPAGVKKLRHCIDSMHKAVTDNWGSTIRPAVLEVLGFRSSVEVALTTVTVGDGAYSLLGLTSKSASEDEYPTSLHVMVSVLAYDEDDEHLVYQISAPERDVAKGLAMIEAVTAKVDPTPLFSWEYYGFTNLTTTLYWASAYWWVLLIIALVIVGCICGCVCLCVRNSKKKGQQQQGGVQMT